MRVQRRRPQPRRRHPAQPGGGPRPRLPQGRPVGGGEKVGGAGAGVGIERPERGDPPVPHPQVAHWDSFPPYSLRSLKSGLGVLAFSEGRLESALIYRGLCNLRGT